MIFLPPGQDTIGDVFRYISLHPFKMMISSSYSYQNKTDLRELRDRSSIITNPNTLMQGLLLGDVVLERLSGLDDRTLLALEQCNQVYLKRLWSRSTLSWFSRLALGAGALAGIASIFDNFLDPSQWVAIANDVWGLTGDVLAGLVAGALANMIKFWPMIGQVGAFGYLISIANAHLHVAKKQEYQRT